MRLWRISLVGIVATANMLSFAVVILAVVAMSGCSQAAPGGDPEPPSKSAAATPAAAAPAATRPQAVEPAGVGGRFAELPPIVPSDAELRQRITELRSHDPKKIGAALEDLYNFGPHAAPAIDDLIELWSDERPVYFEPRRRRPNYSPPRGLPRPIAINIAAVRVLMHIGRRAGDALAKAITYPNVNVRLAVVQRNFGFAPQSLLPTNLLLTALDDENAAVRLNGVTQLAVKIDPAAKPALLRAMHDEDYQVGTAAISALGGYREPALFETLLAAAPEWVDDRTRDRRDAVVGALAHLGLPCVRSLFDRIDTLDKRQRSVLSSVVYRLDYRETQDYFAECLEHKHPAIRGMAMDKLCHPNSQPRPSPQWYPAIVKALRDPTTEGRTSGLSSLNDFDNDANRETTRALCIELIERDPDQWVRYFSLSALRSVPGPTTPECLDAIRTALGDESGRVHAEATQYLVKFKSPEITERFKPRLIELLRTPDEELPEWAIGVLGPEIASELVPLWTKQLQENDPQYARGAAFSLARLRTEASLDVLLKFVGDDREAYAVRESALLGLCKFKDPRAYPVMKAKQKDPAFSSCYPQLNYALWRVDEKPVVWEKPPARATPTPTASKR